MTSLKRGRRGDGTLRQRGHSYELKFSAKDPATGRSKFRYFTLKGTKGKPVTKSEAVAKLRALTKEAAEGAYKAPTRMTFSDIIDKWDGTLQVSRKTAERYRELVHLHVRPRFGQEKLQSIVTSAVSEFYGDLLTGKRPNGGEARPLAPRTIGHIHRLLVNIFAVAQDDGLITMNPARKAKRPKIDVDENEHIEMPILNEAQIREVLSKLRGRPMFMIAVLGVATGMRRGEMLALRWRDVDLEGAVLDVRRSLEQTKEGLRFKPPKSAHGRREISLPANLIAELRTHKAAQLAQRMALGLGKMPEHALVFCKPDGSELAPDAVSDDWRRHVRTLKLPTVSLHALRHTHASQLIAKGIDVLTISRRLGHAKPSVTLDVYSHLFKAGDGGAAAVFDDAFGTL